MIIKKIQKILTFIPLTLVMAFSISVYAQTGDAQNQINQKINENQISDEDFAKIKENKTPLNDTSLKKKKEGGYVTGLPLFNSDPTTGIGYGVRAYYYYNGNKEDKLFGYTPYYHRVYAQFFQTTNGYQYQTLDWDAPYFMNTLFRVRSYVLYEKDINANYFGLGNESMKNLQSPTGVTYSSFKNYQTDLDKIDNTGNTNSRYNKFSFENPNWVITGERDVAYFLNGVIRPSLGFVMGKMNISDYSGNKVKVSGNEYLQNNTRLFQDNEAGNIIGFHGGWDNRTIIGVAFDSRDFEPDPNNGLLTEMVAEVSNKGIGSTYDYQRYTFSQKVYFSPFPKIADLVLAARGVFSFHTGSTPFYALSNISFTEGVKNGLGGLRTMRGFKSRRFVGNTMTLVNFEMRWTMFDVDVLGQNFAFLLVPFIDSGRVFNAPKEANFNNWKFDYGAGLRIAWNQATVIIFDYGMSSEDSGFFINFNHIF